MGCVSAGIVAIGLLSRLTAGEVWEIGGLTGARPSFWRAFLHGFVRRVVGSVRSLRRSPHKR